MTKAFCKSVIQLENRNGILFFDGCDVRELVKKLGTPLYVYSENRLRENYRRLIHAYQKEYPRFKAYYAVKSNNNPAIIKVLATEGAGADVACVNEILMAQAAGIPPKDILYSGVYNSDQDLRYAVENGVRLNLEDVSQLERLEKIGVPKFLCFRINPGIGAVGVE